MKSVSNIIKVLEMFFLFRSSSTFDYGQKDNKKFGDESTSIYSQHFSPEYSFILENAETLEAQFKRQPAHLERLYGNQLFDYIVTSKKLLSYLIAVSA